MILDAIIYKLNVKDIDWYLPDAIVDDIMAEINEK